MAKPYNPRHKPCALAHRIDGVVIGFKLGWDKGYTEWLQEQEDE